MLTVILEGSYGELFAVYWGNFEKLVLFDKNHGLILEEKMSCEHFVRIFVNLLLETPLRAAYPPPA